jgi:hypothetical protein
MREFHARVRFAHSLRLLLRSPALCGWRCITLARCSATLLRPRRFCRKSCSVPRPPHHRQRAEGHACDAGAHIRRREAGIARRFAGAGCGNAAGGVGPAEAHGPDRGDRGDERPRGQRDDDVAHAVRGGRGGDSKAALEFLRHRHDWVAKQQVQVDVAQSISITAALEMAEKRVRAAEAIEDAVEIRRPLARPQALAEMSDGPV